MKYEQNGNTQGWQPFDLSWIMSQVPQMASGGLESHSIIHDAH